jgi:hypothetical protein
MGSTYEAMPDVELICTTFLRNHITFSEIVNGKISTELPNPTDLPCLTLSRVGGVPVARMRLDAAEIQVNAWGRDKREAYLVASSARAALHDMEGYQLAGEGYVTGVEDSTGMFWFPDDSHTPTIARYIFDVRVYVHP